VRPGSLKYYALAGFILSLVIHILTVSQVYLVSNLLSMIMTTGILIIWLQSSKELKLLHTIAPDHNLWTYTFGLVPVWLKYGVYFFILYAIFNFIFSAETEPGSGYFNFTVSQPKLRGLSGFWLAFYALGFAVGLAVKKSGLLQKTHLD